MTTINLNMTRITSLQRSSCQTQKYKKNYQLPFHRFWFMLKLQATYVLSYSFALYVQGTKKMRKKKTNKRKATTTTEICNTVGDCKCKPCQKLSTLK